MDHEQALAKLAAWASNEANVRVLILTGSAALGDESMDSLADLDVELYVEEPANLLDDDSWHAEFGEVLVVEALANPGWHPTRLVYYVGGKIDFMIAPTTALPTAKHSRPFRVRLDKDDLATGLVLAPAEHHPPEASAFLRCQQWFYAAALMCAKAVARREPWQAKDRDRDLKDQLLQMLEWDHRSRYGWSYETWFRGKHLERWVDRDVRAALEHCWGPFGLADTTRALMASVDLFQALATRTADALGLTPFDATRLRQEITAILTDGS